MTCDHLRAAALDPGNLLPGWFRSGEAAAHLARCPGCRDWLAAFTAGGREWASEPAEAFAEAVLARTAGVDALLADLPSLADMDPGPAFTRAVLRATSWQPVRAGWRTRWADAWSALVRRPRFAWEAAYVATVCWVLAFGNPVGAVEWSATNFSAVARDRLGGQVRQLQSGLDEWRASLAPDPSLAQASSPTRQEIEAVPLVVRAWQRAADWVRGVSASLIDALAGAWQSLASWLEQLSGPAGAPAKEPEPSPARSSQ